MTHLEPQLLAFHFGDLDLDERASVEAHLRECPTCVAAFLEVKRQVELAEDAPVPSQLVRARLRRDIAREFGPLRSRWEWPLALAVAAMVVFVAASFIGSMSEWTHQLPGSLP